MPQLGSSGIQALVSSFTDKDVDQALKEVAKKIARSVDDVNDELNKIKIDKDVIDNLANQLKALPEGLRKKIQGMSFDLFSDLINADGAEEKIDEAFKMFSSKIEAFNKLKNTINNDEILIKTDLSDLDKLIEKEQEILEIENRIQGLRKNTRVYREGSSQISSIENEIVAYVKNREEIEKYNVGLEEVEKNIKNLATTNRSQIGKGIIDDSNVDEIKEIIGWLERYSQLTGDLSGLKSLNIPGVKELQNIFQGNTKFINSDIEKEIEGFRDIVKKYSSGFKVLGETQFSGGADVQKLKEQEEEINNMKKALAETESQLEQVNQKYAEQSNLVSKLGNDLESLKESKNPKIIETDEYKNIISELETAKNKASEFQKEMDNLRQTVEVLKGSLSTYNTGDVVPRQDFENANRVIDNLNDKINELETSLTETENKFASLSSEVFKLQQDKSDLGAQLSQQKEINSAQQEQIANQSKIQEELKKTKNELNELLATIAKLQGIQKNAISTIENYGEIEEFKKASKIVGYNEGINTPENFVNFDYLEKAKQKLQELGKEYDKLDVKASVYYNQYLQKGGTEKIFDANGKDVSNELISLYTEMSNLINQTGDISIETAQKILRSVNSQIYSLNEEKKALEKRNKELEKTAKLEEKATKAKKENQKVQQEQTKTPTAKRSSISQEQFRKDMEREQAKAQSNIDNTTGKGTSQVDSSSIVSEQQALNNLEQAIKSVTIAIAEKNKAIQAEEVQMDLSVNQEIKKLEELKNKLTEIKNELQNGISSGLFKNKTNTEDKNSGSNDGNTQSIELVPLIDDNQWIKAVDNIITKIGTKNINIEPDMTSEEWNTLKNYIDNISKQVINMKFVNGDSALPSDLNTSYKNSEKYLKEIWSLNEKIAQAKEKNSEQDLKQVTSYENRKRQLGELLKLEQQFREDDRFDSVDTSSRDNSLSKLTNTLLQEYKANRQEFISNLQSSMEDIEESAYKDNDVFNNKQRIAEAEETYNRLTQLYNDYVNNIEEQSQLELKSSNITDDEEKKLVQLRQEYLDLTKKVNQALTEEQGKTTAISKVLESMKSAQELGINGVTGVNDIDKAYDESNKINNALNNTQKNMSELSRLGTTSFFNQIFSDAENEVKIFNNQLINNEITLTEYNKKVKETQTLLSKQTNAVAFFDPGDMEQTMQQMIQIASQIPGIKDDTLKWSNANRTLTAMLEDQTGEWKKLTLNAQKAGNTITLSFTNAQRPATSLSKFIDELGAKFRNLGAYLLSFVGFYEVWGAIKQGVTYVRELDTALTEMRKVSDETVQSLKEFQKESFDIADSVASTAKEIQNSTADWLRLGYAMDDASELARTTAVYKAVGDDMDIATATESMVSTLQGFQLEADQAANIVDQFNEVSNNFAIDSKGIGDALQRSAASFNAANTGMSEAISLITATNAVLQDPEKVGM